MSENDVVAALAERKVDMTVSSEARAMLMTSEKREVCACLQKEVERM